MNELLRYALVLLLSFAVQLVILFLTEKRFRPLRFAVPVLAGAAVVIVPLLGCFAVPKGWEILAAPLAFIICLALGSLLLAGWGLAWLIYKLVRRTAEKP